MGVLINFGLTGIGIQKRHEFGHEAMPKIVQIDLIFCTAFVFGNQGQFYTYMRDYFMQSGAEKYPQYRQQVKAIKSKVRAQERKYHQQRIETLIVEVQEIGNKYSKLRSETVDLRNLAYQVRNIQKFDFKKLEDI